MTLNFFQAGNKLKQEGKLEESIESYKSAIEQNPTFYWSYHNMGDIFAQLGRLDEAINYYNRAIKLNPNSAWSHHNIGENLVKLGQLEEAIATYRIAIKLKQNFHGFYNRLGKAFYQLALQINTGALQSYSRLGEILLKTEQIDDYSNEPCHVNDADFIQATNNLNNEEFIDKVYHTYLKRDADPQGKNYHLECLYNGVTRQQILTGFRESPEHTSLLISSLISCCLQEAIAAYRSAIELNPKGCQPYQTLGEAFNQLGKVQAHQGKLDEAIDSYKQAALFFPSFPETYYNQAMAFSQQGKLAEAVDSYQKAIVVKPNWERAHLNLGDALVHQNKLAEAVDSYQKAIVIKPDWGLAHLHLGNAFLAQGKTTEAVGSYSKAIAIEPEWALAHYHLANALFAQEKQDEAIETYRRAIALQPDWVDLHFHLGNVLIKLLRPREAIESYQQAIALRPYWVEAHFYQGNAFTHLDDFEQAFACWQRALDIKSDCDWAEIADSIMFHLWPKGRYSDAIYFCHQARELQRYWANFYQLEYLENRFLTHLWPRRIGHFALIDCYVKAIVLGLLTPRQPILLAPPETMANPHAFNYWRSHITIISDPVVVDSVSPLVRYLKEPLMSQTLSSGKTVWVHEFMETVQKRWEAESRSPLLTLSDNDCERGWTCLQSLGIPRDAWFVCLHVREPGYLSEAKNGLASHRNADINTYWLAVQTIVEQGGWVIRMGNYSMTAIPPMEQVVDYANSDIRSDWMDVFLCAQCRFFLGTTSGLFHLSYVFGIPCALANFVPMETRPLSSKDIFIPKLLWSLSEDRFLTFGEALAHPVGHCERSDIFASWGINIVDNTAEEIKDLVVEMLNRLDGKLQYTQEEERLQKQFIALSNQAKGFEGSLSRIGKTFLRKYAWLMPAATSKISRN
ncbi:MULTISPECIES: tetratricopeptide repeat protein [unclassified Microcoleus]|uniref:tetratricopeptide repeat protein n=1 Tax=unclassified Microcoleus TaxID=2642155 RepID=UPI002FD146ED